MGGIHAFAHCFIIAGHESVANGKHAVFFLYHELGAEEILGSDVALHRFEHLHSGVTQSFDTEALCHAFARGTALVVGRISQFVLHHRVNKHQGMALGVERIVFIFHRAAVEAHQMVFFAEHAGKLVHYSAVHAAVVVLGALADTGKLELVDAVAVEHIVDSESKAGFECGRRAEAGAKRHVAGKHGVEALNLAAALKHLAAHAEYIARPRLRRCVALGEAKLGVIIYIYRKDTNFLAAVGADLGHYHLVDSAGEHEAAVIVGMLAYEVDTSGRGIHSAVTSEASLESFVYFFL